MKNVKNHAKQRYCERILGITNEKDWKQHIAQNDKEIIEDCNRMIDGSVFIYRGQLGDNTTKSFRIFHNIVLVMDSQESCLITLFKCSFDFGEYMDLQIIKHEIEELAALHSDLKAIEEAIQEFVEKKTVESTTLDQQIKAMEEQIKLMKSQKSFIDEEIKSKRTHREFAIKEIEKRAVRICNSIEYRKDLNANASA